MPRFTFLALILPLTLVTASGATPAAWTPPILPDARMTPGDTLDVTKADICVSGYARKVRNVPIDVKRQVYSEYGIQSHQTGDWEVDHLIPLELGGSNSLRNLWPQYGIGEWNFHVKDGLESKLHDMVCHDEIDLKEAQKEIASNWIDAYKRTFKTSVPRTRRGSGQSGGSRASSRRSSPPTPRSSIFGVFGRRSRSRTPAPGASQPGADASPGQVWVNTRSGVFWRPGTRYYGKTKQGEYMSEADALKAGYHAGGRQ